MITTTRPLPSPSALLPVSADVVVHGQPIPPIERIRLFSDRQWEEFVLEWGDSLRSQYKSVERCGGAGDMGRDVLGICHGDAGEWDNYQCKHYRQPLAPSDIWVELAKLMFYAHRGDYSYPRAYYFVSPHGVGTKLSNLLRKPDLLRAGLFENWDRYCKEKITSDGPIPLDSALRGYIDNADFTIFKTVQPLHLIDQHSTSRWHVARFGGGLPPRPPIPTPPADPTPSEANYVRVLLEAYGDHLKSSVSTASELAAHGHLVEHFGDSRLEFYSAEALRAFSRDTLPPGEFEKLQADVHAGIKDEIRSDHADGYKRVVAVVKTARALQLGAHALQGHLSVRDRGGICHQMANDNKVKWVK